MRRERGVDLTQDRQVFAAVMDGQYQDNALPCYYNANTLMLDQTVTAHDQTQFEQYRNYLWSPTQPEYGSFLVAHLENLLANGFFVVMVLRVPCLVYV